MMNTKNTWTWLVVAAVLFASIFLLDRYLHPAAASVQNVLSGLQPAAVTSIQVIPAGALEIRAGRTNNLWLLSNPVAYPAQPAAIETLLSALQKLTPVTPISAAELHEHRNAEVDFGFASPQFKLVLDAGDQHWELIVGGKTAPGDQVYLRVVGVDGAFVTDAGWLKLIPRSAGDWRSTALVAAGENNFDSIVLTNGAKIIELHRDATNHLWRMIRPLQARADSDRLTEALQQLQAAQVTQFVTEDAKADLTAFGLQPADLDLWLNNGTNFIAGLHTGKSPANDAAQIYARREGWGTVFTTAREPLSFWRGTVNDFRDPHLLELPAPTTPIAEIEVQGANGYILQAGTNGWHVTGEKFPADMDSIREFLKDLADLRVSEFVKAAVTAPDLADYGFTNATRQIILRSAVGDSNAVIAQFAFAVQTNGVFAHRADEDFIYAITPDDARIFFGESSLFESGWQFRDRRIWNFSETNLVQITLRQNGQTRTIVHDGMNKWSPAPGSQGQQGIVNNPPALEETAHRLGGMTAAGWVARNVTNPDKFGLNTNNLELTVELKSGEKLSVDFGTELPAANTALAAVTLDGERWAFVFPPALYQLVRGFLTIPANAP